MLLGEGLFPLLYHRHVQPVTCSVALLCLDGTLVCCICIMYSIADIGTLHWCVDLQECVDSNHVALC